MSVNTLMNPFNEVIDSIQDAMDDPALIEIENEIKALLESTPIEELKKILAEHLQSPNVEDLNAKACPAGFIKVKGVCVPIVSLLRFLGVAQV
jgi:hypothetical protein